MNITKRLKLILLVALLISGLILWWLFTTKDSPMPSLVQCGDKFEGLVAEDLTEDGLNNLVQFSLTGTIESHLKKVSSSSELNCVVVQGAVSQGYVLKSSKAGVLVSFLQATHAHDDRLTGSIVASLITQDPQASLLGYVSSVSREQLDPSKQTSLSSDLSLALLKLDQRIKIIQIHGFAQAKRETKQARRADIIISSGAQQANLEVKKIYSCLQSKFENTFVYGEDVFELGATKNFLNQVLRGNGFEDSFIHIELSLAMRKQLMNDGKLAEFGTCIYDWANNEH